MPRTSALLMDSARAVWPEPAQVSLTRALGQSDEDAHDYLVLPGFRSPKWLVPVDAPAAASALASTDGGAKRQAALRLLTWAHRTGITRLVPLGKLRVETREGIESLVSVLSEMLGEEVSVAVRLGSWQHARSLIVRVFDADGGTRAFAKVGLDAHGRAAVRAEQASLTRAGELGLSTVVHPRILGASSWRGLEVLLISALLASSDGVRGRDMPLDAMRELALAGTPREDTVLRSGWAAGVVRRLAEVTDAGQRVRLESALRAVKDTGEDLLVPLGCWHGDWTPWNMTWDGSRVMLWDWEHFAEDVPVGFDQLHYLAQELRASAGTGEAEERIWLARARDVLGRRLGFGDARTQTLMVAYLLEANLRFVLDRQSTPAQGTARAGWGLELMTSEAERLVARQ